ncbi:YajG family lipoprotein [Marinobacterium rhizophilum]|uniref:Lipoprotein n=1 Tax=Marinobacterium rhizophilum TaxID=420402 RepID=A0ABY5HMX8_9GAMM|nr:YajG family lipoprotein [Marinobacterium rhizophilum]UTW13782.1 hypothetical protein KDW95_09165 [Marinobacterium rhizophilum]
MPRLLPLMFCLFALTLGGCTSLSPQQIELQPQIDSWQRLPSGIQVELDAKDLRSSPIIGHRVSRFEQNAFITLARDARYTLLSSAQQGLRQMGAYQFGPATGQRGQLKITLLLDELSYKASQEGSQQQVRLQMKLRLVAQMNGRSLSGEYRSEQRYQSPFTPSESKNQELFNLLASDTLTRAFNDPKLLQFINQQY